MRGHRVERVATSNRGRSRWTAVLAMGSDRNLTIELASNPCFCCRLRGT
jgi:hypothetical protein